MILKNKMAGGQIFAGVLLVAGATAARADLVYVNDHGTGLIYDTVDKIYWTQNANISGDTFTHQQALTWASTLAVPGVAAAGWHLPTTTEFTSLFGQLDGSSDKFGSQVFFGIGPNDYVSNVSAEYWTDAGVTDFNFYYGYPGYKPDSNLYAAWAVSALPEPSGAVAGLLTAGVLAGCWRWQRAKTV